MIGEWRKLYLREHADEIKAQRKQYRAKNSDYLRGQSRDYMRRLFDSWGSKRLDNKAALDLGRAAEIVCIRLLIERGYDSIIHLSELYPKFPAIDICAKMDGVAHAFQVTASVQKIIPNRAKKLILWNGWIFHVIFIRSSFTDYWECVPDLECKSSVRVPIDIIKNGGTPIPEEFRSVA